MRICDRNYLNLDKVDGLHEPRLGQERRRVEDAPRRGDDLSAAPVDGVSVQGDVVDVEAHSAHVLVAENTLEWRRGLSLERVIILVRHKCNF